MSAARGAPPPPSDGSVGLLGGVFDPPHRGHVELARTALRELGLARLVVVVTGIVPHKDVETPAETRFRLAEAAFGDLARVELSRREVDLDRPSYTVETAQWAAERFVDPVFVVGADEFADFLSWREPEAVLEHVRLAVATRPGYDRPRLEAVRDRLERSSRVSFFEMEPIPIASRDIRARSRRGEPLDDLVPMRVARLIKELNLYRGA